MAETVMKKAEMKVLLARSKSEPVNCAVAQGDEPAIALLLMNKIKQPLALEKSLKTDFPTSKNHRHGTVAVDVDDNPKLAKFYLNKPGAGLARRLVKTLKGTGFSKVRIMLEDGTEVENHEEEDEEEALANGAAPEAAAGAPPPPAPPPPPAAGPDLETLRRLLATLAPQIPRAAGTDDRRKAELMKLATDANVNLKTGNLTYAATYLRQLQAAIETPAVAAGATVFAKSRMAWVGTQQKIEADMSKLAAELSKAFADQPAARQIDAAFAGRARVIKELLGDRMIEALDAVIESPDANARAELVTQARNTAKDLLAEISSNKLIDDLDDNPFAPLALRATLTRTITGLSAALVS